MPFPIPTLDKFRERLVAFGRALFPSADYGSLQSYHGRRATYISSAATSLHAHANSAQLDVHPLTAGEGKPINDWGEAVGVARKTATPARKSDAGRVRGAAGATVTSGEQLRDENTGLVYAVNQSVTIPGVFGVDPDSFVDADIVAIDTGSATRINAGAVLKFIAPPPNIETIVMLQLDLDEDGFDAEQFGSYRSNVLAALQQTPSGGNQSDFVKWAIKSLNSVATAFAYPNRAGKGTIDVVAFYNASGTARSLSSDDRATVLLYIQTQAPFHVAGPGGPLRVLTTVADPQNVEITLQPNGQAAFAFQWDDATPLVVLSWNGTTRELRFTTPLPISMRPGHSLVLRGVASPQDGREFKIESLSGSDKVILEKVPAVAPVATDVVYSGGPLVTPVRDAIVAHLNGQTVYAGRGLTPLAASAVASPIGLDILAEGIGSANPAGIYNSTNGPSWSGAIIRATLAKIATYKGGVMNVAIVTPVADYEAVDDVFPLDAQIHYVTPGAVLVRKG